MKQYIDKSALVAEIERITNEQQEICKADVALGKAPESKNIEVIYQFQQFTKFLNTLEVKEVNLKNSMTCEVCWYDGFFLDYTQEQQDELLKKIGANVGDKIRIILAKE